MQLSIFQSKGDPETRERFQYKMILKKIRMGRPRSSRLPFLGLVFGEETGIVVACAAWESGKPVCGFPLFHPVQA
jgi:hypothetical protein